jgi:DNA-directed RNA polymerase specialized sigma24 family protein
VVSTTALAAEDGNDPLAQIVDGEPTPEFAALVADEYRRLIDSLADEDQRRIAHLKLECYSNKEIAERLGYSERKVERKLAMIRRIWDDSSPV